MTDIEARIQARLATLDATAMANHDAFVAAGGNLYDVIEQATRIAEEGGPPRAVLTRLQRLIDDAMRLAKPFIACRAGCDHCCHIPLIISDVEAEMIGRVVGRRPKKLPAGYRAPELHELPQERLAPCPFLKARRCSIYADRPLSCRLYHSLDVDSLMCEPIGLAAARVPSLDFKTVQIAAVAGTGLHPDRYADIRAFF